MKAAEFNMTIDNVFDSIASLKSCKTNEKQTELNWLISSVAALQNAQLTKANARPETETKAKADAVAKARAKAKTNAG